MVDKVIADSAILIWALILMDGNMRIDLSAVVVIFHIMVHLSSDFSHAVK